MIQRPHRVARAAAFVSFIFLAGCQGSSDSSDETFLAPGVNDLSIPSGNFWVEDGVLAAQVFENGVDQNGDGDGHDLHLHALDLQSGRRWMVPEVAPHASVGGGYVAYLVLEDGAAGDLNGDGDVADVVLHVLDTRTGRTASTGVACFHDFAQDGALIAFGVSENSEGADLDGNGKLSGIFAFAYEADRARLTPLGIPVYPDSLHVDGRHVVFSAEESECSDLNGDGDALDPIVQVWDAETGALQDTRRACDGVDIDGPLMAILVPEFENGNVDLNGNGTGDDLFAELHDLDSGTFRATTENDCLIQGVGGGLAVLMLGSPSQPGRHWVYDALGGELIQLHGYSAYYVPPSALCDRRFAYVIDEAKADADLDGDGLKLDSVLHTLDVRDGNPTNVGHATYSTPQIDEEHVVFLGVSAPPVARPPTHTSIHVLDLKTRAVRDLEILATDFFLADDRIVALTSEAWQGTDLNADHDLDDTIVQVHDLRHGETFNTGLPFQPYFDEWKGMELDGETLVLNVGGRLKAVRLR